MPPIIFISEYCLIMFCKSEMYATVACDLLFKICSTKQQSRRECISPARTAYGNFGGSWFLLAGNFFAVASVGSPTSPAEESTCSCVYAVRKRHSTTSVPDADRPKRIRVIVPMVTNPSITINPTYAKSYTDRVVCSSV
jgi:hypothetical protein